MREGADEFWRQKAYRTKAGRVIKASDAGFVGGDPWNVDHEDIIDWGINHGLISIADRGGEGFIGHDGRFYSRDEMEREYRQQLNREIDQRSDIARFHQEDITLRRQVDAYDLMAFKERSPVRAYSSRASGMTPSPPRRGRTTPSWPDGFCTT